MSKVCLILCLFSLHKIIKILLNLSDNKLLMEKDLWVLVGNDDDVDIVRQMSHLLLEIMCKDMVSTELTMFFLEEVIESQKSLRSPISQCLIF